jgi:hypothetical protein
MILCIEKPSDTRLGIYLTYRNKRVVVCDKEDYCRADIQIGDVMVKVNGRKLSCKMTAYTIIKCEHLMIELEENSLSTPLLRNAYSQS